MRIDLGPNGQINQQRREPFTVRVPFLRETVGLGDAIEAAVRAVGVEPCGGCQKRAQQLNQRVSLSPWAT